MAYNVQWDPKYPEQSKEKAEARGSCIGQVQGNGFLYRFEDVTYAQRIDPYDDSDDNWTSVLVVEIIAFPVRSWTKCGATLYEKSGERFRFVNLKATKKFACKTVDDAIESFIARKKKQAAIYRARADKADRAIELARPRRLAEFLPK